MTIMNRSLQFGRDDRIMVKDKVMIERQIVTVVTNIYSRII